MNTNSLISVEDFLKTRLVSGQNLNGGISENVFDGIEKQLEPYKVSKQLQEMYYACNGQIGSDQLFMHSNFLSFEDAYEEYKQLIETCSDLGISWPRNLFPIGLNENGYLVTEMTGSGERRETSPVLVFFASDGSLDISIETSRFDELLTILDGVDASSAIQYEDERKKYCPFAYFSDQKGVSNDDDYQNFFNLSSEEDVDLLSRLSD